MAASFYITSNAQIALDMDYVSHSFKYPLNHQI